MESKENQKDVFHSQMVRGAAFSQLHEFPLLKRAYLFPQKAVAFDEALTTYNVYRWVHFYQDDYRFERIWSQPERYVERLRKFQGVISPDFSIYRELPLAMQIWNTYRNRAIGYKNPFSIKAPNEPISQWGDKNEISK